jgi:hypothetical protein
VNRRPFSPTRERGASHLSAQARGHRSRVGLTGLILAFLYTPLALAQPQPKPQQLPANDASTTLFRGLLHFHKVQPESIDNLRQGYDYSKLIVVVVGEPKNQKVWNSCRSALGQGGAVLILADTPLQLSTIFPNSGDVRITGDRVTFAEPGLLDRGVMNRPLALPMPLDEPSPFFGIERVATLDPSYCLSPRVPAEVPVKPVGAFRSGATVFAPDGRVVRGAGILALPFALATTDDGLKMRCMIVADPDVFSNRLIYTSGREESPNDNLKLANNTVQWLKGGTRTKCLFIENGVWRDKFDEFEFSAVPVGPPLPPPPNIPVPDITDEKFQQMLANETNKIVDQAERNDVFDRGILSVFQGRKGVLLAVLAGLLVAVAYILFRWRAVRDRYRSTFRPIPKDPAMLGPDVPVGSIEHRRLELLRSADYGPALRQVVRQLFQDRGLPAESTGDTLPALDIAVARPQFLRDAIHSLWAVVRSPAPVGFGRWKQLEPLLAAVRAAADDDRWRFVAPSPHDAAQ